MAYRLKVSDLSSSQARPPSRLTYSVSRRRSEHEIGFKLGPLPRSPNGAKADSKFDFLRPGFLQNGAKDDSKLDFLRSFLDEIDAKPNKGRRTQAKPTAEEAAWGNSVLLSLTPAKKIAWDAPKRIKTKELINPPKEAETQQERNCGPSMEEALARLENGIEDLGASGLREMTISFNRFRPAEMSISEVPKGSLPAILTHLGHFFVTEEKVARIAEEISLFDELDFEEFGSFVTKWCEFEREEMEAIFTSAKETLTEERFLPDQMASLLKPLGIVFVRSTTLQAFKKARLKDKGCRSFKDFLNFVAAYQATQGLSAAQLEAAKRAFDEQVSSKSDPTAAMQVSKNCLSIALVQARGEHVTRLLPKIFEGINWDYQIGISFREFCSFLRKLWEYELKEFEEMYEDECDDDEGSVSLDGLSEIMKAAGYTLFSDVTNEILEETKMSMNKSFDFSDAVQFLLECQRRKGFSKSEFSDLHNVFSRFDYDGSNDIDYLELIDMLRHLGYDSSLKEAHRLTDKFDFRQTGTLDFEGFLYFMRLYREEELKAISSTYAMGRGASEGLPSDMLDEPLVKLGYEPMHTIADPLLSDLGNPKILSYENFVYVVDHFRRLSKIKKRKRAGFSDKEFKIIRDLFKKHSGSADENATLVKGTLILLLMDAGIPMDTRERRDEVYEMREEAREAAKEVGIQEECLGRPQTPRCRLYPLVHLLRAIFQKSDRRAVQREEEAVEETQFQPAEVSQFREIYLQCCGRVGKHGLDNANGDASSPPVSQQVRRSSVGAVPNAKQLESIRGDATSPPVLQRGRRASAGAVPAGKDLRSLTMDLKGGLPAAQKKSEQNLSLRDVMGGDPEAVVAHVKSILGVLEQQLGMRLSMAERVEFTAKINSISGKNNDRIDFPDFLRLMKWMLLTDFAKIKSLTSKVVEHVRTGAF
jgi:Ca2+-binding EF-hand superfamily protein